MLKLVFFSLFIQFLVLTFSHADSPYGVKNVGTTSGGSQIGLYGYDTAGNRLSNSTNEQAIQYGLIGKAVSISQGSFTTSIKHGLGSRRYLRVDNDGNGNTSKTFYLNGMDCKIDANNTVTNSIRINAKGYSPIAQVDIINGSNPEYTYFVQDHLGSPVVSIDDTGTVNKRNRYDAWGQMTNVMGVAHVPTVNDDEKIRGYTGHELMAKFNLGQWNGRVFDYEIGAFPQADKYIQGSSIPALNRYALGQNNNPNILDWNGWRFTDVNSLFSGFRDAFSNVERHSFVPVKTMDYQIGELRNVNANVNFGKTADYYHFTNSNGSEIARFELSKMVDEGYLLGQLDKLNNGIEQILRAEDSSTNILVYRGDAAGIELHAAKLTRREGYEVAQNKINTMKQRDLFAGHAGGSANSPLISVTTDIRVARRFMGRTGGSVYAFRIPMNRLTRNIYSDAMIHLMDGSRISEAEFLVPNYIRRSEFVRIEPVEYLEPLRTQVIDDASIGSIDSDATVPR